MKDIAFGNISDYTLSIELLILGKGRLWFHVFTFQIVGPGNLINCSLLRETDSGAGLDENQVSAFFHPDV